VLAVDRNKGKRKLNAKHYSSEEILKIYENLPLYLKKHCIFMYTGDKK